MLRILSFLLLLLSLFLTSLLIEKFLDFPLLGNGNVELPSDEGPLEDARHQLNFDPELGDQALVSHPIVIPV
jgi:hypothetical protein